MDTDKEIPINTNLDNEVPFLDEAREEHILEDEDVGADLGEDVEVSSELSEDLGSLNELREDKEEVITSYDIGNTLIILLKDKNSPFLGKITEILPQENLLKLVDEDEREFTFLFEGGEILMTTDSYEILDMIKVIPYDPLDENEEYSEVEFESEELVDKIYSDLAKRDDLLSALIHSMNIYDNNYKIQKVQETIDIIIEMIESKPKKDISIPSYMIPIIDDSLKIYSENMLQTELIDENNNLMNITSYKEYINNSIKYSKPIETKNGYGLITEEYSDTYLRNCLQDDNCFGINGAYTYDERKNNSFIKSADKENIVLPNRLRIIGLLEEPYNEHVYSVNRHSLQKFTLFEKFIYEINNSLLNRYKKRKIKESNIINKDDGENRENDKYLLHSLDENDINQIYLEKKSVIEDLGDLLLNDENISDYLYNYNDIEKLLFKYDISFDDLTLSDRQKLCKKISENIKKYPKNKYYYKRNHENVTINKNTLTDSTRVKLAQDIIFKCKKREERNEYLKKFIDLFLRNAEKEYEDKDYFYNKYTDDKSICKHYIYECNISNDNDVFNSMKSIYGLPPEDGIISCRVCGCMLCNEDTTLFDGYEDDKPMITREVMKDDTKELEIKEFLNEKEDIVKIINDLSDSIGINIQEKDIYEILLSYELLDHEVLSDRRYGMLNVSYTDIHPRVNNKIKSLKTLEKKEKDKKKRKEYKTQRENVIYEFQRWLKNTNSILMISALLLIVIQTSIPTYFTNNKNEFIVLDMDKKTLNNNILKYICAKIRRLSEKYNNEEIWNDSLDLFNEKEYNTNSIEIQLGHVVQIILQPNFPRIVKRVTLLEDYILSKKNKYLREEWPTFKPLKNNLSVINTNKYLDKIQKENIDLYRKVYGGYTIENNSLIRPMNHSFTNNISEMLSIPEIEIYKNNNFKVLLRYVVSLYGKRENNLFISMTIDKLINDSSSGDDIHKIFMKYSKKDILDIHSLRNKIIPDLLSYFGNDNNKITSCYSDERSCNEYIHNLINNYDLPLLNTSPKRIYYYKPPLIYPDLPFGRLNTQKRFDLDGNQIMNFIEKIFNIYVKDEMGNLIKKYQDNSYHKYYVKLSIIGHTNIEMHKFKNYEKNNENFEYILDTLRKNNSLPFNSIQMKIEKYKEDDLLFKNKNFLETRFYDYLSKHNVGTLKDIFHSIVENRDINISKKIDSELKLEFSNILNETDEYINNISKFLASSDNIKIEQKRRFIKIFNDFNSRNIIFNSENISSILLLFTKDNNLRYKHLYGYLNDIKNILSRLTINKKNKIVLPKEWKCTDSVKDNYMNFMDRDDNDVYLYLHNNIFMKTKDKYNGFNRYLDTNDNCSYFKFLRDKIDEKFLDLDLIKGSEDSKYDNRYSDIYMKYHFMGLLNEIVIIIRDLITTKTDVTDDANDLFQSLEIRDEESIDDMIEVFSMFFIDLLTHIMFQHYDPSWLFLNEQKLDLSNRLSKQKEREKQIIIDKLDNATREERLAIMEKNKMGISLFYKIGSEKAGEYVNSEEYNTQTESERVERLNEIYKDANLELEVLQGETSDVVDTHGLGGGEDEEGGYDYDEEYDPEDTTYGDEGLDDEQEAIFNE
tara:strand:+ start:166 stop:4950 length:4785 start_codon:yes stop_codon:yes gene_type:complete